MLFSYRIAFKNMWLISSLLMFLLCSIITPDLLFAAPESQGSEALFAGLDKITGQVKEFSIKIGHSYKFGELEITPRICYSVAMGNSELGNSFVEVNELTIDRKVKQIFSGWMFANSPALNALDHSIYDFWLTGCAL